MRGYSVLRRLFVAENTPHNDSCLLGLSPGQRPGSSEEAGQGPSLSGVFHSLRSRLRLPCSCRQVRDPVGTANRVRLNPYSLFHYSLLSCTPSPLPTHPLNTTLTIWYPFTGKVTVPSGADLSLRRRSSARFTISALRNGTQGVRLTSMGSAVRL